MGRYVHFSKLPFAIIVILLVSSCDQSDRIIRESLIVTLDLEVYKTDTIQLFYILKTDDGYTESLSIKKNIEGKPGLQKVSFQLPETIKPKNIRIDLGNYVDYRDSIRITSVSFRYRDQVLEGSNGLYKKWFTPNSNISFGQDSLVHILQVKNEVYDPYLKGNEVLNSRLVKLFPPDIYERRTFKK